MSRVELGLPGRLRRDQLVGERHDPVGLPLTQRAERGSVIAERCVPQSGTRCVKGRSGDVEPLTRRTGLRPVIAKRSLPLRGSPPCQGSKLATVVDIGHLLHVPFGLANEEGRAGVRPRTAFLFAGSIVSPR